MKQYILPFILYFIIISILSAGITVYDKRAAIRHRRRVPEATLLLLGLCGGAAAMFLTMRSIRHKTQHPKFMIGLPLEMLLQAAILILVLWCGTGV